MEELKNVRILIRRLSMAQLISRVTIIVPVFALKVDILRKHDRRAQSK